MEKVKNRDTQFELVVFSQQVLDKAIATRLSFAQRESNNYQALEYELPNLWEVAQKSYQRKAWKIVLSFQDALRPFLDRRGYWSRSRMLNGWAVYCDKEFRHLNNVRKKSKSQGVSTSKMICVAPTCK